MKKRLLNLLLAFIMIVSSINGEIRYTKAASNTETDQQGADENTKEEINLLANGNFENGLEKWEAWGNTKIITVGAHEGTKALGVYADCGGQAATIEKEKLIAGHQYQFSYWYRFSDKGGNPTAKLSFTDKWGPDRKNVLPLEATDEWTYVTYKYTLPADYQGIAMQIWNGPSDKGVSLYLDDIRIVDLDATVLPANDGNNLLANGNFENGLEKWNPWSAGNFGIITDKPYEGTQALLVYADCGGESVKIEKEKLTAGHRYQFSYWYRFSDKGGNPNAKLTIADKWNQTTYAPERITTLPLEATDEWYYVQYEYTLPADNEGITMRIWNGKYGNGVNLYLDDIKIVDLDALDAPVIPTNEGINIWTNGNFENGLESWTPWSGMGLITEGAYEGTKALVVSADGGGQSATMGKEMLTAGHRYQFSYWYRFSDKGGNPNAKLTFTDKWGPERKTTLPLGATDKWTYAKYEYTLPEDYQGLMIQIWNGKYGSGVNLYLDDIRVVDLDAPLLPDLIVNDIKVTPNDYDENDQIEVAVEVKNIGAKLYEGTIDIATEVNGAVIPTKEDAQISLSYGQTTWVTLSDTYQVGNKLELNIKSNISQTSEEEISAANNKKEKKITPLLPDFIIENIVIEPYQFVANDPIKVKVSVRNIGKKDYSGNIVVKLRNSAEPGMDSLHTVAVTLPAGEQSILTLDKTAPGTKFTISAEINAEKTVREDDYNNNSKSKDMLSIENEPYQWGGVAIGGGGYATGMVMHPAEEDLIYVRTDVSGLLRWHPTQRRWENLLDSFGYDDANLLGIDGLALDVNNTDVIYIEGGAMDWSGKEAHCLLKSTDRGKTWEKTAFQKRFGGNFTYRSGGDPIQVDPQNSDKLFVGSRYDGLWICENATAPASEMTFTKIKSIPDSTGRNEGVRNVVFNPVTNDIYVSVIKQGLYVSQDGGKTFTKVENAPSTIMRIIFNEEGTMYLTATDGVFIYEGGVFQDITPRTGRKYSGISISPDNPDVMLAAVCEDVFRNDLYLTENGGKTWKNIMPKTQVNGDVPWRHADEFASATSCVLFNPYNPKQVWLCDWYAIYRTDDIYAEETVWSSYETGHESTVGFRLISTPGEENAALITGLADVNGFRHEDIQEYPQVAMTNPQTQETKSMDFCEEDPQIVVRAGSWLWGKGGGSGGYSTDNARSFKSFETYPNQGGTGFETPGTMYNKNDKVATSGSISVSSKLNENGIPTIVIIPSVPDGKGRGDNKHVPYYSKDYGKTWTKSTGAPVGTSGRFWDRSNPLSSDRVIKNKFYLYDYNSGYCYISTDGGATWQKGGYVGKTLDVESFFYCKAAPYKSNEVWVSLAENGIYRSTDGGQNFEKISIVSQTFTFGFGIPESGIPQTGELTAGLEPTVFVFGIINGVEGIFRSTDAGMTWIRINDDNNRLGTATFDMEGDRQQFGRVYLTSNGTGTSYGVSYAYDNLPPKVYPDYHEKIVRQQQVTLSGSLSEPIASVKVNGAEAVLSEDKKSYAATITLTNGSNEIKIIATDLSGNISKTVVSQMIYNKDYLELQVLQKDCYVTVEDFRIKAQTNTDCKFRILVNDLERYSTTTATSSLDQTIKLAEGTNRIKVVATDERNNPAEYTFDVTFDKTAPVITLDNFTETTTKGRIYVIGRLSEPGTVKINGIQADVGEDLSFKTAISLKAGVNEIELEALDLAGNKSGVQKKSITLESSEQKECTAKKAMKQITIDGVLDESIWKDRISVERVIEGSTNNMVDFTVSWNEEYLYVGGMVEDDKVFSEPLNGQGHQRDSAEVYMDLGNEKAKTYDRNDAQFNIGPGESRTLDNGVSWSSKVTADGYSFEIAVPWAAYGIEAQEGKEIGLDIGMNEDDNGYGRSGVMMWHGNGDNWQNTSAFGTFKLVTSAQEDISSQITFADGSATYNGSEQTYEAANYAGGTLTYSYKAVSGTLSSNKKPQGAGTYIVTASFDGDNAFGEKSATFTINKATIAITANNQSAWVGDKQPTYTYQVTGLASGEQLAVQPVVRCDGANMSKAGGYIITPAGAQRPYATAENYNEAITYINGTLTVTAKASPTPQPTPQPDNTSTDRNDENKASTSDSSIVVDGKHLSMKNIIDISDKGMTLTVLMGNIRYDLPAAAIDTKALMKQFGTNDSAKVAVEITIVTTVETAIKKQVEKAVASAGCQIVVPAMEFHITASYEGKTVEIKRFSKYVERTVEVTEAQAGKITTALVVEGNKTRHVPTKVYQQNGKWYVSIKSLTNSTYILVSKKSTFTDLKGKSYAVAANELANRNMMNGFTSNHSKTFAGDKFITNSGLITALVRALGLPENGDYTKFKNVTSKTKFAGALGSALEYGLITKAEATKFVPGAKITHKDAMVMITRAAKIAECSEKSVSITKYAKGNYLTRGEAAVTILDLLQKAELITIKEKK